MDCSTSVATFSEFQNKEYDKGRIQKVLDNNKKRNDYDRFRNSRLSLSLQFYQVRF